MVEGQRPPQTNPGLGVNGSVTYKTRESGKPGYYTDYNLTVEHSFTPSTLLRTSFHANYGIKIFQSGLDFNQLDPKYFAIYGNLLTSPVSSVINNPIVVAAGFKLPYRQLPAEPAASSRRFAPSRSTAASARWRRRPVTAPTMVWKSASRSVIPRASG